jgi:hypothetical protein
MECLYKFVQKTIELESLSDKIKIFFFGDVHRDTAGCDVDRWKEFLKEAKETPNAYFFYMGDGNDFASTKEKAIIDKSGLHDTTRAKFDMIAEKDIRRFCTEISFMKGRMLGVIEGNHSWIFMNGQKSDEIIADRLQSEFLGWLCAYTLTFKFKNTGKSISVHFTLCHGGAGGKRAGSSINQVEDLKLQIFGGQDIYVMAHDHNRGAWPTITLLPTKDSGWHMKEKQQWLCRSGTFKRGYTPNTSGYEIGRLLRPSDMGALCMEVGVRRSRTDGSDVLYPKIKAII